MLDDTPNKLESVWIQRNTENQYYEEINISGSDLIVYHSSSGEIQADKISVWAAKYGLGGGTGGTTVKVSATDTVAGYLSGSKLIPGNNVSFSISNPGGNESLVIHSTGGGTSDTASYMAFDGNRPITRNDPSWQGVNVGTDNVVNFLDKFFFPFNAATISINSGTTYYETGSSQNISINGSVTSNSETVFGSGSVRRNGIDWYTFPSASSYSTTDTGVSSSQVYQTLMQVGNNGSPTLINSSVKSVAFIYPFLYGMSPTAGLSGTALYTALSKDVSLFGNKTYSLTGFVQYIYFAYPATNPDLVHVLDPNLFDMISSFELTSSVPVTSSGLTTNWNATYKVYQLHLQADPFGNYQFKFS